MIKVFIPQDKTQGKTRAKGLCFRSLLQLKVMR